jgi:VanZ family protein
LTPDPPPGTGSRWSAVLAALTLAFVAYGSFVPLHFAPRPLDEAWHVFRHAIPVRVSPSDLAVNVLIMASFPFFLLGALPASRHASGRVAPALGAWVLSTLLSAGVEFGQTYFPPRHPSLVDIAAQSFGAALGALVWIAAGPAILSGWRHWKTRYGPATNAEWILWPYLAVLFLRRVWPLDLMGSPAMVQDKWRAGRAVLLPFARASADPGGFLLGFAVGVAGWMPVAALLALSGRVGALRSFLLASGFAALTEGVRLLVLSRRSEATDLVAAVLGAAAGAMLGTALRGALGVGAARGGAGAPHGVSSRSPALAQPESSLPSKTTSAEKE